MGIQLWQILSATSTSTTGWGNTKDSIPDDWAPKAFGPVKLGSALGNLLVDLLLGWRTTAYTASMPAIAIKVALATTLGYAKYVSPDGMIITHSEAIVAKVSRKVPELVDDQRLREALLKEFETVADEFRAAELVRDSRDISIEPIWADFLKQEAFAMSVWSSQRVSYVAFYNACEAFLTRLRKDGVRNWPAAGYRQDFQGSAAKRVRQGHLLAMLVPPRDQ